MKDAAICAAEGRRGAVLKGSERKVAPMTSPNVIEIKLDRLIDDMRVLRSQMIAFDRQLKGIEACLKPSEPSEQPEDASLPASHQYYKSSRQAFSTLVVGDASRKKDRPRRPNEIWR
jgi:hypothetical protein